MENSKGINKSFWLNGELEQLINHKDNPILDYMSFSSLINYCLAKQLPQVMEDLKNPNSNLSNFADTIKRRKEREIITSVRKEQLSNIFFYNRVFQMFKKLKNMKDKNKIVGIFNSYIEESKTYKNNKKITKLLISMRNGIYTSKSLDKYFEILDIEITNLNEKADRLKVTE